MDRVMQWRKKQKNGIEPAKVLTNSEKFAELIVPVLMLLRFFGYDPMDSEWSSWSKKLTRFSFVMILIIFNFTSIKYALTYPERREEFGECLSCVASASSVLLRMAFLIMWKKKFAKIVDNLRAGFARYPLTIHEYKDDLEEISKNNYSEARLMMRCVFVLCNITGVLFLIGPLLRSGDRLIPFASRTPFDSKDDPYYQIDYLFSTAIVITTVSMTCGFDLLFMQITDYICTEMKILRYYLKKLGATEKDITTSGMKANKELIKYCVETHVSIMEFNNAVREAYSYVILLHLGLGAMKVCFTTLQLSAKIKSTAPFIAGANEALLLTAIGILFCYCFYAEKMTTNSVAIADAAFDNNWYTLGTANARDLQMILMCAQRPLGLTAGGFANLDLTVFIAVVKAAYSVYTVFGED